MKLNLTTVKKAMGITPKSVGRVFILDGNNVVGHRVVNLLIEEGETPDVTIRVGMREEQDNDKHVEKWNCVERVKFVWEDKTTYDNAL